MSAMRYRRGSAVRRNRSPTQAQFGRIAGYDSLLGVRDPNQTGDVRVTRQLGILGAGFGDRDRIVASVKDASGPREG